MIDEARAKMERWVRSHTDAVLYDPVDETLLDVASGKTLRFPWREVEAFEEKMHPETGAPYLVFLLASGVQVVLVDPGGVAFAPSQVNTGPLPDAPQVVCLRDFGVLLQRVNHQLEAHPDDPVPREILDAVMLCLAVLDGARAVGFDVGDLEQALDASLRELERRGRPFN